MEHTVGEFTVKQTLVTPVRGQFNESAGTISFDPADQIGASAGMYVYIAGDYLSGIENHKNIIDRIIRSVYN